MYSKWILFKGNLSAESSSCLFFSSEKWLLCYDHPPCPQPHSTLDSDTSHQGLSQMTTTNAHPGGNDSACESLLELLHSNLWSTQSAEWHFEGHFRVETDVECATWPASENAQIPYISTHDACCLGQSLAHVPCLLPTYSMLSQEYLLKMKNKRRCSLLDSSLQFQSHFCFLRPLSETFCFPFWWSFLLF